MLDERRGWRPWNTWRVVTVHDRRRSISQIDFDWIFQPLDLRPCRILSAPSVLFWEDQWQWYLFDKWNILALQVCRVEVDLRCDTYETLPWDKRDVRHMQCQLDMGSLLDTSVTVRSPKRPWSSARYARHLSMVLYIAPQLPSSGCGLNICAWSVDDSLNCVPRIFSELTTHKRILRSTWEIRVQHLR